MQTWKDSRKSSLLLPPHSSCTCHEDAFNLVHLSTTRGHKNIFFHLHKAVPWENWLSWAFMNMRYVLHQNQGCQLVQWWVGLPTFKTISSDLAGWWLFWTIFHEDFKNVNFINIGHTLSTLNFWPHSPRTGSASGYVGRSLASTGFVWSKNQEGYFC